MMTGDGVPGVHLKLLLVFKGGLAFQRIANHTVAGFLSQLIQPIIWDFLEKKHS